MEPEKNPEVDGKPVRECMHPSARTDRRTGRKHNVSAAHRIGGSGSIKAENQWKNVLKNRRASMFRYVKKLS